MSTVKQVSRCGKYFLKPERNKDKTLGIFTYNKKTRQTIKLASTDTSDPEQAQALLEQFSVERRSASRLKDATILECLNWYYLKFGKDLASAEWVRSAMAAAEASLADEDGNYPLVSQMDDDQQLKFIKWHRAQMVPESPNSVVMVRRFADSTIMSHLSRVRTAMKTMRRKKEILCDVPSRVPNKDWKPIIRSRKRVLTIKDWAALFNIAGRSEHRWRYLHSALSSGGRPTKIARLTRSQIDLRHGLVTLHPENEYESNKRNPTIPLVPAWAGWLKIWCAEYLPNTAQDRIITWNGQPLLTDAKSFFRKMVAKFDPTITPYTIRHSIATWLASRGVERWERRSFMGHQNPNGDTGDGYEHFDPKFMRGAANAIQELYKAIAPLVTVRPLLPPEIPVYGQEEEKEDEVVGVAGIEPAASALSQQRSTAELHAPVATPVHALSLPAWQVRVNRLTEPLVNQPLNSQELHHVKVTSLLMNQSLSINYRVTTGTKDQ